jgi:signal transduction histidine kinase
MAWTTSAGLRVRPIALNYLAARLRAAQFLAASLRRALERRHPSFAFALPLAALGFLAPLVPASFTAAALLATATGLTLFAARAGTHGARARSPDRAVRRAPVQVAVASSAQRPSPPTRRARIVSELKDRSWADLMARVNHDLRTPLNAVIGFSELMALELFGPLGDERYQDYVHHIRDSATDLLKSAEDTLALTALMAGSSHREPLCACGLDELAAEAWTFLERKAASRAVGLDAYIPAGLEVLGEPRALRQVLINMLSEGIARAAHAERVILFAVTEGELVEITLSVSKERPRQTRKGGSLAICLARTLLEMHGASLLEFDGMSAGWHAVTVLDRAVQPDFFREPLERQTTDRATQAGPVPQFG